jgi:uncharacterized membrane protein
MKHKSVERERRVILRSNIAGLLIGLGWTALVAVPFVDWPNFINYLALISFPVVLVTRVMNPNGVSGRTAALMFVLLPILNALVYGFVAFVICRFNRRRL